MSKSKLEAIVDFIISKQDEFKDTPLNTERVLYPEDFLVDNVSALYVRSVSEEKSNIYDGVWNGLYWMAREINNYRINVANDCDRINLMIEGLNER
ncbi:hypothetical protein ST201phi2-1p416 [Pseudomonas phage 201phi2-1]|uniref:Uncharacterized protein n=1 Tax=Pseudomonas phage 201phi2-1 TaxID=198110 RepID=B3FJS5_BP201|nr:hypothetical protein ST201phi2-1p416 [Pseudomonas phage 201phi2-1]ABY63240.1 hypothetical protein 201phi2-1p416 [Pseudomonas phage 201phi2-1]